MAIYELNAVELEAVSAGSGRVSRNVVAKQKIVNVQVAVAKADGFGGDATAVNQAANTNNASSDNISG